MSASGKLYFQFPPTFLFISEIHRPVMKEHQPLSWLRSSAFGDEHCAYQTSHNYYTVIYILTGIVYPSLAQISHRDYIYRVVVTFGERPSVNGTGRLLRLLGNVCLGAGGSYYNVFQGSFVLFRGSADRWWFQCHYLDADFMIDVEACLVSPMSNCVMIFAGLLNMSIVLSK